VTAAKRVALAASLAGFGIWGGLALAHDPRGTATPAATATTPATHADSSSSDDNGFFDDSYGSDSSSGLGAAPAGGAQLSTPSAGAQPQARSGAS